MKYLLTLLLLTIVTNSCVESGTTGRQRKVSYGGSVPSSPNSADDSHQTEGIPKDRIVWHTGEGSFNTITFNANYNTIITIRGEPANTFLSRNDNNKNVYCLVSSFHESGLKKQIRLRAVPKRISYHNSSTLEWGLRVDLPSGTTNRSTCAGTVEHFTVSGQISSNVSSTSSPQDIGHSVAELCTNCSGIKTAQYLALYEAPTITGALLSPQMRVPEVQFPINTLRFQIDTESQSKRVGGTCSQSACKARGFDCCSNTQCVNDGEIKPNAQTLYPAEYAQAIADIAINPKSFINYPNIFFICTISSEEEDSDESTTDNTAQEERDRFNNMRLDYLCLESAKLSPPEYDAGECSNPDYSNSLQCTSMGATWNYFCRSSGGQGRESDFIYVREKVWEMCGCREKPLPNDPYQLRCPDYGLKATRDHNEQITKITCLTPKPSNGPIILQKRNLAIPARSAPHRFFKEENGDPIDDISSIPRSVVQEGTEFFYVDNRNKFEPQNGEFNMNAVLGQFSLTLNRALPAKVVPVEIGESYIISAVGGSYTPCAMCPYDNWLDSLLPFPQSQRGFGLQAVGYPTNRSLLQDNLGRGNYEDTIFGRACWVPPTMIPLSHQKMSNIKDQRLKRLKTQAALYINGYQRDWYGFNQGALIGSFDGVSWFAIGGGRRVVANTDKLFLAINAPFADLAERGNILVDITTDQTNLGVAALHDYNPNLKLTHPQQNLGGACRSFHQCKTDSDCVTKLGWEYMCADTSEYRTHWPIFNAESLEKEYQEIEEVGFEKVLVNHFADGSSNRCVYRGSGSICKININHNIDEEKKKLFTCAPNFYCANLSSSSFNQELVRSPNQTLTFLYGQEANILGRPKDYIGASSILDEDIIENIKHNMRIYTSDVDDIGLCLPGKSLTPLIHTEQAKSQDPLERTDYINQISSCNSRSTGFGRVSSCPTFQNVEDQMESVGDYILNRRDMQQQLEQNMCGGEILNDIVTASTFVSSFEQMELGTLRSLANIERPALAVDACLRRPGAVCHTDLDCGPNRLHEEQAFALSKAYFGDTTAEILYWQEYLICGQPHSPPNLQDEDYYEYDLTKNRCCREVGKSITMFTQDKDQISEDTIMSDAQILDTSYFPYNFNSAQPSGFYSRYASIPLETRTGTQMIPYHEKPLIEANRVPKSFQWKAIADTGENTCCGGGWIRKFKDGGNDWRVRNRLKIDYNDFSCLNYISELALEEPDEVNANNYQRDYDKICLAPGDAGCVQIKFDELETHDNIINPSNVASPTGMLSTVSGVEESGGEELRVLQDDLLSTHVPYIPVPFHNHTAISDAGTYYNYFYSMDTHYSLSVYLPIYIGGRQNILSLAYQRFSDDGPTGAPVPLTEATALQCANASTNNPQISLPDNSFCLTNDPSGLFEILHVKGQRDPSSTDVAGLIINFNIMNSGSYCYGISPPSPGCPNGGTLDANRQSLNAGGPLYYLTKFGRLELLGIPQIWYEPIYCNSNRDKLIENIFDLTTQDRTTFENTAFIYNDTTNGSRLDAIYDGNSTKPIDVSNPTGHITFEDNIIIPNIFSANDFMCCLRLGENTESASKCCSGYATRQELGNNQMVCKLPSATNINVYLNRFISSEGTNTKDGDEFVLTDDDFIPETGEPKLNDEVDTKLRAIGEAHCESGAVRQGASFGNFQAGPNPGYYYQINNDEEESRYFSITDDRTDLDTKIQTGTSYFRAGFKWYHHIYCE